MTERGPGPATETPATGPAGADAGSSGGLLSAPLRWFRGLAPAAQDRLVGLVLFLPSASVLGTALWLTPDPSGVGTHKQLGLGGCTVLTLAGIPCPMCGMTTTFTHLAHLQVIEGAVNQPFGVVLFSLTVLAAVVGGLDLLLARGRWRRALGWLERRETLAAIAILVGMFAGWIYKIALLEGWLPWSP